ncbi:MAG: cytidine deaminase [Candidatus Gastranaerophilaceae bacterium]
MDYKELLEKAKKASENSYSPYSKFPVGAAVVAESGKVYIGTNVENSSFGATICAERSAIVNAIVNGERKLTAVAIYGPKMKRCAPCGVCRQVINDFKSDKGVDIILEDENGNPEVHTIDELLPLGFDL